MELTAEIPAAFGDEDQAPVVSGGVMRDTYLRGRWAWGGPASPCPPATKPWFCGPWSPWWLAASARPANYQTLTKQQHASAALTRG